MYDFILNVHSILRWVIVIAAIFVIFRGLMGWVQNKSWAKTDGLGLKVFTIGLDLQLVIGLVLYIFLSPVTKSAFQNFGGAMKDSALRFYAVEHILLMLAAIVLLHIGGAKVKKALKDRKKFRMLFIYSSIAFVLIMVSIPWPFMANARPWL
jgi:hypothetical protein